MLSNIQQLGHCFRFKRHKSINSPHHDPLSLSKSSSTYIYLIQFQQQTLQFPSILHPSMRPRAVKELKPNKTWNNYLKQVNLLYLQVAAGTEHSTTACPNQPGFRPPLNSSGSFMISFLFTELIQIGVRCLMHSYM